MRVGGQPAIGLGVIMDKGGMSFIWVKPPPGNKHIQSELPMGVDIHVVADQPEVVEGSIQLFQSSLSEAIIIVLAVSFLSLGMRTGMVVALSIPLVLVITFFAMKIFGIDLQRISLGALVIALGFWWTMP